MADNLNTVYLSTPSGHGNQSADSTVFSDLSMSGTVNASDFRVVKSGNTVFGGIFSGQTSGWGSTTSLALADGEFSIVSFSATSCILAYRSGSTVYKFFAREAEGLSTTP